MIIQAEAQGYVSAYERTTSFARELAHTSIADVLPGGGAASGVANGFKGLVSGIFGGGAKKSR